MRKKLMYQGIKPWSKIHGNGNKTQSIHTAISIATGGKKGRKKKKRVGSLTVSTKLLWQMRGPVPLGIPLIDRLNRCPVHSSRAPFPLSLDLWRGKPSIPASDRSAHMYTQPPCKQTHSPASLLHPQDLSTHRHGLPPRDCSCCKCVWSPCLCDSVSQKRHCC